MREIREFGAFRLDAGRRRLERTGGETVDLGTKPFDALVYLVEHAGEPVSRKALIDALWPDTIVEENNLTQVVSALRRVLGEGYIVTLSGRGYQFVGAVKSAGRHSRSADVPGEGAKLPYIDGRIASKDWRLALREEQTVSAEDALGPGGRAGASWPRTEPDRSVWRFAVSLVVAAGLSAVAAWMLKPSVLPASGQAHEVIRAHLDVADGQHLSGGLPMEEEAFALQRPSGRSMAFSPNGRYLVYAASDGKQTRLYRHALSQDRVSAIAGTEGAAQPFFSPDGSSVGFFVGDELKRVDIETGAVRTVAFTDPKPIVLRPATASWTMSDTILFSAVDGIYEVPARGGTPVRLTTVMTGAGERLHVFPQMLPGRRALMWTLVTASKIPSEWNVVLQTLDSGDRRVLVKGATDARYLPTGHVVFARAGSLLAMPFDLNTMKSSGTQSVVIDDVMYAENGGNTRLSTGTAQVAISAEGSLAYVPGGAYPALGNHLAWVDRTGERETIPLPTDCGCTYPRLSPDGGRLAYDVGNFEQMRLWVYDLKSGIPNALTTTGVSVGPVWSPDGTRLAFARFDLDREIYTMPADGSSQPEPAGPHVKGLPSSWSRDNVLAFVRAPDEPPRLWTVRLDGKAEPEPFGETVAAYPSFSPDGKWLAYASRETGRPVVYVRPFPEREPRQRISTAGGWAPVWSGDGSKLYFRTTDPATHKGTIIMEVDLTTEPTFTHAPPRELFRGDFGGTEPTRSYDITPDGKRFVMMGPIELTQQPVTRIDLVLNWFDELERLVPTK